MDLSILRSSGLIGAQVGNEWIDGITDYEIISSADGTTELIIRVKMCADMAEFNVSTKTTKQHSENRQRKEDEKSDRTRKVDKEKN